MALHLHQEMWDEADLLPLWMVGVDLNIPPKDTYHIGLHAYELTYDPLNSLYL